MIDAPPKLEKIPGLQKRKKCLLYQMQSRFGIRATGDFDNDGYDDLAIGVPGEAIEDKSNAGAVNVLYEMLRIPT